MKNKTSQKHGKRRFSEGGRSIKDWVGRNMEGQRLRLGQKPYNKPDNSMKQRRLI
jgi:hypothetical protein